MPRPSGLARGAWTLEINAEVSSSSDIIQVSKTFEVLLTIHGFLNNLCGLGGGYQGLSHAPNEIAVDYLKERGIVIATPMAWGSEELAVMHRAVSRWEEKSGWPIATFLDAFENVPVYRVADEAVSGGGSYKPEPGRILLPVTTVINHDNLFATMIHELAHRWDDKSGWHYELSDQLVEFTAEEGKDIGYPTTPGLYKPGHEDDIACSYSKTTQYEDFATAVEALLVRGWCGNGRDARIEFYNNYQQRKSFSRGWFIAQKLNDWRFGDY